MSQVKSPERASGGSSIVRLTQLDFLRGIAILLVLGRHSPIYPAEAGKLVAIAGPWGRFGWTGVDLFFVLSGFLVGGLLLKEWNLRESIDVKRFLLRRGFKIWPSYYVFLVFVLIISLVNVRDGSDIWGKWLWNMLHIQNYLGTLRLPTWSLAVEEHFYLILPFVLPALLKNRARAMQRLTVAVVLIFAVCLALRGFVAFRHRPTGDEINFAQTQFRIDSLFAGVGLAGIYHLDRPRWEKLKKYRWCFLVIGIFLVSPMIFIKLNGSVFIPVFGFMMLSVGYFFIVAAFMMAGSQGGIWERLSKTWICRAVIFTGVYSYNVYLWQMDTGYPVGKWLLNLGIVSVLGKELTWLIVFTVFVVVCVLSGMVLGRLVEIPFLKIRDRLFPPRDRGGAGVSKEGA